jgi:DNA-binding transcriptional regulator LsrR (DeoR family)
MVRPSTRKEKSRALRRELTDEERVSIALDRFGPLQQGMRTVEVEVLSRRYQRDPAVISRAINEAFRRGLVQIRKVERVERPNRAPELEAQLQRRFDLLGAIVIEPSPLSGSAPEDRRSLVFGDELHAKLGSAMAQLIATGTVFRSGSVIGLGSGRGVFHTVDALSKLPPLRAINVALVSLTGAVFAQDHAIKMNLRLDADFHVNLLGQCFAHPVEIHQVHAPIVLSDPREFSAVRKRTWLGREKWEGNIHGLFGVGVLKRGHRFNEFVDESEKSEFNRDHTLDPILEPLRKLIGICRSGSNDFYCPVADICNNLFFVPPPPEVKVSLETITSIRKLIDTINKQLVNISEEQLRQIQNIILVAGGIQKACAVRELLMNDSYHILFLCTDGATAREILK